MEERDKPIDKNRKAQHFIRRTSRILIVLGIFLCLFPSRAFASENEQRVVRIGYYNLAGFQEYDEENDSYSGYSYEFLMALQQYTDWKYEFVPCEFADALVMLQNGELDLVNNVSKTPERESVLDFSTLNSGENMAYLAMKSGDIRVALNDYDAIGNIIIGLAKDSIYSEELLVLLKEKNVSPKVQWYANQSDTLAAFESGKVDAHIITSSNIAEEHIVLSFAQNAYYLATTKGNSTFVNELDAAIEALRDNDPYFELHLKEKYYRRATENYTVLTKEEEAYREANPVAQVLYQVDWYPLCYQDEKGDFAGAIRGVYDLLEERTGLKFEYIPVDNDSDKTDLVEDYHCQIMAEQPSNFSEAGMNDVKLTKSFVSPPLMEVANHMLESGDTIVLVDGDYLSEVSRRIYGEKYQYVYCNTLDECLEQVKRRKADGTVLISYESEFYRQQRKYSTLTYTIIDEGSYSLSIAVSNKADPRLYSIMEKGLNSISNGEISNIFNKTLVSLQHEGFWTFLVDNPLPVLLTLILFVALIVGAVLGWIFVHKLRSQNDIIHEKNLELKRANQATTNFFSRMSHDMRTPMNGILGVARLSKEETDVTALKENMTKVEDSGEYLLSLINDTLDFQQIESGKMKLKKEIVNCREILRNIVEMVLPAAENKNIELRIDNKNVILDCYILVDPVRMKQIFINLLSNAIKFTSEGGVISVEYECKEREGMISHDRFYIRDTGIGMSQDFIKNKMFHPFSQEQNEVTGQYAGSGLGLSIVKSLVDLMGGTIEVESEIGVGTTFILNLDFERVNQKDIETQKEKKNEIQVNAVENLRGRKILLVEDHPLNAEIAIKLLNKVGCQVVWAKNGQEGIECFLESAFYGYGAILMDIRMPVKNGLLATQEIRRLSRVDADTIPIIAMTANAYEEDIKQALDAGMNAHLAKPIEPDLMYETIARELTQK